MNEMNEIELEAMAEKIFCDVAGYDVVGGDIAQSTEKLHNFIKVWGNPDQRIGEANIWWRVQTRKGAVRGDLVVVETAYGSASYFSGQA